MTNFDEFKQLVEIHGQQHLLGFWDDLDDSGKANLADQIKSIDFEQLQSIVDGQHLETDWAALASRAELPPAIDQDQFFSEPDHAEALDAGQQAIAAGEVAMILTAGGQGTRLGFDHPKGLYPIGPISGRTLYQMIIEQVTARARQFDATIPLYVMTSPPTHDESEAFLDEHNYFGYSLADFRLFCQGVMPAVNSDGKLLLADRGRIFVSPDGHGGTLAALDRSGSLADMRSRGIKHVFYGQIDNPLIQACDPALIGYHILRKSEMTTQVVRKHEPLQKVGNVVSIDGVVQIIEYSDLPEEFARQTNEDGSLKLWAGSIAVHVFDTAFLCRANEHADSLPFHRARKKVPFVDELGQKVEPSEPNAIKFEKFIFDLLPLANNAIVCEVDPAKGFCAVKNAPPAASETPDHVKAAISDLHASWLRECGVEVAEGVRVEINPLFAVDQDQLRERIGSLGPVKNDTYYQPGKEPAQ